MSEVFPENTGMPSEEASKLAERVYNGDAEAFGDFWIRHLDVVWGALRNIGEDAHLIEDTVQETAVRLISAMQSRAVVITRASSAAFVGQAARNTAKDRWRKLSNRNEIPTEVIDDAQELPIPTQELPETVALTSHFTDQLLSQLSDDHRKAFQAVILNDQTYKDFAAQENIPVGTAKSRVSIARQILKKLLAETPDVFY